MRYHLLFTLLFFLAGCSGEEKAERTGTYFDLQGYFGKEIEKLEKEDPLVRKSVGQDSVMESREMRISNWSTELELFSESDINKPAWRDSYQIVRKPLAIEYLAKDKDLRTRRIHILLTSENQVKQIDILNQTANPFYSSTEQLTYTPGTGYTILKKQHVAIIGPNAYAVSTKFKNQASNK
jgi:hypothetical protein